MWETAVRISHTYGPIPFPYQPHIKSSRFHSMHRLSHCRFGHGHMVGQFFRVLPPAHHGINGTEKVQLLPPGVAGPMEALPACTSPLQGSGNGFYFPRTINHRALSVQFSHSSCYLDSIINIHHRCRLTRLPSTHSASPIFCH